MNAVVVLDDLAKQINIEHVAAIEHARSAIQRARKAGELLIQAKYACSHGQWLPWLTAKCPAIAERTAQAYMRLARSCLVDPLRAAILESLTLSQALAELADRKSTYSPDEIVAPKSATLADLNCKLVPGFVALGTIEHPHGDSGQIALIIQESRKHPGYWHIVDFREGTCTRRPIRVDFVAECLRFYIASGLCTWSMAADVGDITGEDDAFNSAGGPKAAAP